MKLRMRIPAAALALLLLAGCGGPAEGSPSPAPVASPSPSPVAEPDPEPVSSVAVHWDALTPRQPNTVLANRLKDEPMPELTPGKNYGQLVPYIGAELQVNYGYMDGNYSTDYLYGLSTSDGLILTDPVYQSISQAWWYDAASGENHLLPILVLTQTVRTGKGPEDYGIAVGLAAADGSWYTGMKFSSALSSYITATPAGLLMCQDAETAIMIGLDGKELFRWSPDDFLPPDSDARDWFFQDGLNWSLYCYGELLYFGNTGWMEDDGWWIDPKTGKRLDDPSLPEEPEQDIDYSWYTFSGGRYQMEASPLVIEYDDGSTETIALPSELGRLDSVSREYLVFSKNIDGADWYTLTDHDCKTLYSSQGSPEIRGLYFYDDALDGVSYPWLSRWEQGDDPAEDVWYYQLLSPEGKILLSTSGPMTPYGGLLATAEETVYRLVDVRSNCRELIRLPRWAGLDLPAE